MIRLEFYKSFLLYLGLKLLTEEHHNHTGSSKATNTDF